MIVPKANLVLVQKLETKSKIELSPSAKEHTQEAVVIRVGDKVTQVKEGEKVLLSKSNNIEVKEGEKIYQLVYETSILAAL